MKRYMSMAIVSAGLVLASSASATVFTRTSPTGGLLPGGVTEIGGLVLDLTGANGVRVVSQVAASSLYVGSPSSSENPLLIGTQTGFTPAVIAALGGGLNAASIRVTLFDGDNQAGNFDFNQNSLTANGVSFGNFSAVATQQTNSTGLTLLSSGNGFGDNILSTGFFSLTDPAGLNTLFASLGVGTVAYRLVDVDPGDQFYDFTQGIDGGLINVGSGPVVQPPTGAVPEPATWAMIIAGFGFVGASMRRRSVAVRFGTVKA
jgi:hypothetical protein